MAIAIDASSPARVNATGSATAITTASFTAPSGAILLACFSGANLPGGATATATDSGGLTWTTAKAIQADSFGFRGFVYMAWARTSSATARTVTVTMSGAIDDRSLKVYAITGALASGNAIGNSGSGSSATNNLTVNGYTSSVNNSRGFSVGTDWNELGVPTSTDTEDGFDITNEIAGMSAFKAADTTPSGTVVQFNLDAGGTGTAEWAWAAVEVLPAAGGGSAVALDGTLGAVSALSGTLAAALGASGTLGAVSVVAGNLGVAEALSGTLAAAATPSGNLGLALSLTGSLAAASDLSGSITNTVALSGTLAATSSTTGALVVAQSLVGTLGAAATVGGALGVAMPLSGSLAAVSTAAGELEGSTLALSGTLGAVSVASGTLGVARGLSGSTAVISAISGDARLALALVGSCAAQSALGGNLTTGGASLGSFGTLLGSAEFYGQLPGESWNDAAYRWWSGFPYS